MHVIKSIKISNFRSIRYLKSPEFGKFNLITGKNTSGKSSLLEALFLSVGPTNPTLAVSIHKFRKIPLSNDDVFRFIFRDFSLDNQVKISITTDNFERSLNIQPYYSQKDVISDLTEKAISSKADNVQGSNRLSGVKFNFINNDKKYSTIFSFKQERFSLPQDYEETFAAHFISYDIIMNNLSNAVNDVIINKQKEPIIAALKEIDPDISDIALGKDGIVRVDLNLNQLVPVNLLGDGMINILGLLAYVYDMNLTTIFIDEIDSGLHYSSMGVMWKALLKAAVAKEIQLFATTHSYDCIEAYNDALKSLDLREHARLLNIGRGEEHELFSSDADLMEFALDKNFELR